MSSVNSISGGGFSTMMSGMKRPDPSKMVDNLFSKLDTTNKGYLEKSDLQSALSKLSSTDSSSSTSTAATVDEMFKKLDSNNDGKITKNEMSSGMKKLADALDSQFNQMRMNGTSQGGKGGMPPAGGGHPAGGPPPAQSGTGSTNSTSGTNSASATQSNSTKIYEKADTNQDGKVSEQERIAAELASQNSAPTTSTSNDARILKQIMEIMHAYSSSDSGSSSSGLSVTA